MTTAQVARAFRAKRVKKGKYSARCPVHDDKHPSLWIMEGEKGCTVIGCWSGCDKQAILSMVGLTWGDLFRDSKPDLKAMREAERQRAVEERERRKKKDAIWKTVSKRDYWIGRAERLGKLLAEQPDSDRLGSQFHLALDRARELDQSVVEQMVATYKFKADDFMVGE